MTELEELQAKHREEAARKREKLKERKARAHRLIERGAILEAALKEVVDPSTLSNEEVEQIVYFAILSPLPQSTIFRSWDCDPFSIFI